MKPLMSDIVRVIKEDGTSELVTFMKAQQFANDANLDLIFISNNGANPVFKIMDEGKHLYEQKRKEREARKKQKASEIQIKEVKFKTKIDDHDFETKENMIKRFLTEGKHVKVTIVVKGREGTHPDIPRALAERVIKEASELVASTPKPKAEGSNIIFTLEPA